MDDLRIFLNLSEQAKKTVYTKVGRKIYFIPGIVLVAKELLLAGKIDGEKMSDGRIKIDCNRSLLKELNREYKKRQDIRPLEEEQVSEIIKKEARIISQMKKNI